MSKGSRAIHKLKFAEGFQWLLPVDEQDFERLSFDGGKRTASWKPIRMALLKETEDGRKRKPSDFPACSGGNMLVLSRTAKDELGDELERHGELLPLASDEGEYWTFNVTTFVDALDEGASQLMRASDTGDVLMIRRHVFDPSRLGGAMIFKLPQTRSGLIYVTDPFVRKVQDLGLVGLEFPSVWTSEARVS